MAIANFFDKAALAAAQVLQGVDHSSLIALLEHYAVGLAFDDAASSSPEGKCTLELAINLLSRFYPRLVLQPNGEASRAFTEELIKTAKSINPQIEISQQAATTDNEIILSATLAVGDSKIETDSPVIYVGSNGWLVRVSSTEPVGIGNTSNPLGAGAAACFGAANIFRLLYKDYLTEGEFDDSFTLSLLDYEQNAESPINPEIEAVHLGESFLVGLGAIGNAAAFALARTPALKGLLHLIDHETTDLSNLQRYVLTTQDDIGAVKVNLAAQQFSQGQLIVQPHQMRWGEFLRNSSNWNLERVAAAVDTDVDRRAIQASLPKQIVNSWTQTGDLGISRHSFLGDDACLTCLYFPDEQGKHLDRIVLEALGLPEEALMEIRTLLYNNAPIGRELLERAAAALNVPLEPLLQFEGAPLINFYTQAICGGIVLKLGGDIGNAQHQNAAVPLAFQSALAGIMLAAELIAEAGNLRPKILPVTTKIDLLRPLKNYLNQPAKKAPSGNCICQDKDYIQAYNGKYS